MSIYTTSGDLGHIAHPNDLLPIGGGLAPRRTNQVKGKCAGPTLALLIDRCDVYSIERDGVLIFGIRLLELKLKCDRNQDGPDTHMGGLYPSGRTTSLPASTPIGREIGGLVT